MYGDVSNADATVLSSGGRLYHRRGSMFSDTGDVTMLAGSVADLGGTISGAESVPVDALRINYASDALWDDAGDVSMATGDTFTLTFNGDITHSASVSVLASPIR